MSFPNLPGLDSKDIPVLDGLTNVNSVKKQIPTE